MKYMSSRRRRTRINSSYRVERGEKVPTYSVIVHRTETRTHLLTDLQKVEGLHKVLFDCDRLVNETGIVTRFA